MLLQSLRRQFRNLSTRQSPCSVTRHRQASQRASLNAMVAMVESLEDRTLLAQVVVLNQPADFPGEFNYLNSSVNNVATIGNIVYDDFVFEETTQFNTVAWQGLYLDSNVAANPVNPNTATWRVNIWNDNGFGTGPGEDLLVSRDVAAANINAEFVDFAEVDGGIDVPVYNFGTQLGTTFEATADSVYWFSVISISAFDNNPTWNWMSGTGGDGASVQQEVGATATVDRPRVRAMRFIHDTGSGSGPTLIEPSGTISDTTPTFSWEAVPGADQYDIWVNVLGSNELVFRNQNVNGTTFTPTAALAVDQSYIWTVRAIDNGVAGDWATHARFTVSGGANLGAPTNLSPTGTVATRQPTFEWTGVAGASRYDIWVNVRGSNELVVRDTNVASTSFTPSTSLEAGQSYIWTVRAIDATNAAGAWATHATFQVDVASAPPGDTPMLIDPVDVANTPVPTFDWSAVTGATHYDIWVNIYGSNQLVFRDRNVTTTELESPVTLTDGQHYIWTVRAFFNNAAGDWAAHEIFRVNALVLVTQVGLDDLSTRFDTTTDEKLPANGEAGQPGEQAPIEPVSMFVADRQASPAADEYGIEPENPTGIDEAMALWSGTEWWADKDSQAV